MDGGAADEVATADGTGAGTGSGASVAQIHRLASAELSARSGALKARKLYDRLCTLKRRPLSIEWLEAVIMVNAIGRMHPARTNGFLNKLRDKRAREGNPEAFAAFDASLRAYLLPGKLTNHAYLDSTFEDLDHGAIWSRVRDHLGALGEMGYEVFLNSGTLLGVVRDARLIDHDDDIDLAVILKAGSAVEAAGEWVALKKALSARGLIDGDNAYRLGDIHKLTPAGKVEIDLFPAWIEGGRVHVYPHTFGELAAEDLLPLAPCPVSGLSTPAAPEKMLALNYGAGWRDPDPLFKFPWGAARVRFADFLNEVTP